MTPARDLCSSGELGHSSTRKLFLDRVGGSFDTSGLIESLPSPSLERESGRGGRGGQRGNLIHIAAAGSSDRSSFSFFFFSLFSPETLVELSQLDRFPADRRLGSVHRNLNVGTSQPSATINLPLADGGTRREQGTCADCRGKIRIRDVQAAANTQEFAVCRNFSVIWPGFISFELLRVRAQVGASSKELHFARERTW